MGVTQDTGFVGGSYQQPKAYQASINPASLTIPRASPFPNPQGTSNPNLIKALQARAGYTAGMQSSPAPSQLQTRPMTSQPMGQQQPMMSGMPLNMGGIPRG